MAVAKSKPSNTIAMSIFTRRLCEAPESLFQQSSQHFARVQRKRNMAIKVKCGSCDAGFKAKDELAGRRVKCPKCKEPLTIPSAPPKRVAKPVPAAPAAAHNPLLDLLDEQNVQSAGSGGCLLYTSPSPRDRTRSRMPSSA